MKDLAPAAPAYSGGKLVIYEGDYTHITLTDALYMVLAVLVAILGILVIQHYTLPAKRPELVQLFEATFPAAP